MSGDLTIEEVESLEARLRRDLAEIAETVGEPQELILPTVVADDEPVVEFDLRPQAEERLMTNTRWILAGLAAAAFALIVGFVALSDDDDEGGLETFEEPEESTPTTTAPATSAAPPTTQEPVVATGECGLGVAPEVAADAESVTFDVTSDPSCAGEEVQLSATPAIQGLPIQRNLTLDATGAQSVSDQLLGSRQAEQDWSVQVIVGDSGSVAATSEFTVGAACDLEASADLQVTYLPDTNEVTIVLTVDPVCAGTTLTFDPIGDILGGPQPVYTVDETGRIETTKPVLAPGPIIAIAATESDEEWRFSGLRFAQVVVDISD